MNKRFQVFVSSTYSDLMPERAEVMQALLELDCMPAGMELFPAASEEQWSWIKKVIDESDYYIVVVAGRYGSVSEATGLSFTEMEYRYAVQVGKPTIAFLHEDPAKIEIGLSEVSPQARKKLTQFRILLEQRLCKYYRSPADVGAKVSRSLTQLIKHRPATGWIRADQVPQDLSAEVSRLHNENHQLQRRLEDLEHAPAPVLESLSQGRDLITLAFTYTTKDPKTGKGGQTYWVKGSDHEGEIELSWDQLFTSIAPLLIPEAPDYLLISTLNQFIGHSAIRSLSELHPGQKVEEIRLYGDSIDKVTVQFLALGLMTRPQPDVWALTGAGRIKMIELIAEKRKPSAGKKGARPSP